MLFTAQSYTDKLMSSSSQQHAVDKLAPLVRCPHLSQFWLSASVLSRDADKPLLCGLQPAGAPQLKRLMLLKQAHKVDACLTAAVITQYVPCAPDSWLLPVRDIQPAVRELEWTLDVAAIRQAGKDSADQKQTSVRWSPTSCLLGGVKWGMKLECGSGTLASRAAGWGCMQLPEISQLAHFVAARIAWSALAQM